ncbi:hypothetical protein LX36DRAFT_740812 [Colletotrichum falcatum]|nr:hypothetical protein LX36DRAFT_740812 [Colletotrichum falcatum]
MDSIPLHHDVAALPAGIGHHHGDFLTAVPSNRPMRRTTLALRAASLLVASVVLGIVASAQQSDKGPADGLALGALTYGAPTAVLAWLWSLADVVALLAHRRRRAAANLHDDDDDLETRRSSSSWRFSWGRPGAHVAAHLLVWAPTMAFIGLLLAAWWDYARPPGWGTVPDSQRMNMAVALVFFMFVLMTIHFSLFVLACAEVDGNRRRYSDVVYLPRGSPRETTVPVPPTTPWELFSPRRLRLSYFASHYVRFVPAADGTVTVARDYSSRQARF